MTSAMCGSKFVEVCHGSPTYRLRVEVGERVPRNITALGRASLAATLPLISADGNRVLSFSCSGPVCEMTRKRLIAEVGPRVVKLRDRIQKAVEGFF